MTSSIRIVALVVFLAGFLAGCEIAGPDHGEETELSSNRKKWDAYQDGDYNFVLLRGCFCILGGPHWVQVVDHQVDVAISTNTNQPVPADDLQYIESVSDVFDMIEEALESADSIEIEYSEFGYPLSVNIDWIKQAIDDEMFITISNLQLGVALID